VHDLLETHINTLFQCDAVGRLRTTNETNPPPGPRFYMARSAQGNAWRIRHDVAADITRQIDALCRAEPPAVALPQPPQCYAAVRALLEAQEPVRDEYRGPAYVVPREIPQFDGAVLITNESAQTLARYFKWLLPFEESSANQPVAAVVIDGVAVSCCFCSRIPGAATEAGVFTAPESRGHGYATAAVAAWAAAVWQRGVRPMYSTSWDNTASQHIAARLDMTRYAEDWSIT
jgi:RimJ/RimL family protein N-acetyltransferase